MNYLVYQTMLLFYNGGIMDTLLEWTTYIMQMCETTINALLDSNLYEFVSLIASSLIIGYAWIDLVKNLKLDMASSHRLGQTCVKYLMALFTILIAPDLVKAFLNIGIKTTAVIQASDLWTNDVVVSNMTFFGQTTWPGFFDEIDTSVAGVGAFDVVKGSILSLDATIIADLLDGEVTVDHLFKCVFGAGIAGFFLNLHIYLMAVVALVIGIAVRVSAFFLICRSGYNFVLKVVYLPIAAAKMFDDHEAGKYIASIAASALDFGAILVAAIIINMLTQGFLSTVLHTEMGVNLSETIDINLKNLEVLFYIKNMAMACALQVVSIQGISQSQKALRQVLGVRE